MDMSDQVDIKPEMSTTPVTDNELDAASIKEEIDIHDDIGVHINVEEDNSTVKWSAAQAVESTSSQPTNVDQQPTKRPANNNKITPSSKRKKLDDQAEAIADEEIEGYEEFIENIENDSRKISRLDQNCTSVLITNFPRWRAKLVRQFILKRCMTNQKLTVPRIGTIQVKYFYDFDNAFINVILITVDCSENQYQSKISPEQGAELCRIIWEKLDNSTLHGKVLRVYPDNGGYFHKLYTTNNKLHSFRSQLNRYNADDRQEANITNRQTSYPNKQINTHKSLSTQENITVWQMPLTTEQDQQELYGLTPSFLKSLNITLPINDRVIVSFTTKLSLDTLKQTFDIVGRVIYIFFINPAAATVCFSHPLEAVQAIAMFDGALLYKKPISVKMDKITKQGPYPNGFTTLGKGLGPGGVPLRNIVSSYQMMMIRAKQSNSEAIAPSISEFNESTESRINVWSADDEADDMQQITNMMNKFKERGVNLDKVLSITNNVFGQSKKSDESKTTADQRVAEQAKNMPSSNPVIQTYGSTTPTNMVQAAPCPTIQNDPTMSYQSPNFTPMQNQYPNNVYMASQGPNLNPNVVGQGINLNNNMGMPGVNYNANIGAQNTNFHPNMVMQGSNFNPNPGNFSVNPNHNFPNQASNFGPNVLNQTSNFNPNMGIVSSNVNPNIMNRSSNVMEGPRIISNVELVHKSQAGSSNMPLQNPLTPPAFVTNINRGTLAHNSKTVSSTSTNVGTSGSKRNDVRMLKELPADDKKVTKSKLVVLDSLPASVTQSLLHSKMQECGEVRFVEITSPGHAFVRFENVEAAERCLLLFNKSRVDGQIIHVKYF